MLKMFPCVSEQATIIENMFYDYAKEYSVKEWYNSKPLFSKRIIKYKEL